MVVIQRHLYPIRNLWAILKQGLRIKAQNVVLFDVCDAFLQTPGVRSFSAPE